MAEKVTKEEFKITKEEFYRLVWEAMQTPQPMGQNLSPAIQKLRQTAKLRKPLARLPVR